MPSYITPKKNSEFVFSIGLLPIIASGTFVTNPTIDVGDFKISKDGGALTNITNLPIVTPVGSKIVKFTLTADEMNADNITIIGSDAAVSQWKDIIVGISTTIRQIDDLTYPAVSGRSLDISTTGEVKSATNIKKNVSIPSFAFIMTDSTTHNPVTGKSVTGYKSIDGGAFILCDNSVTEISNGVYTINLSNNDMNGNNIILRFVSIGTDDRYISLITQP